MCQGILRKCASHLRVALEHHPSDEGIYLALAAVEIRAGNRPEAAKVLRQGAAKLPGRTGILFPLADLALEMGILPEADRVLAGARAPGNYPKSELFF